MSDNADPRYASRNGQRKVTDAFHMMIAINNRQAQAGPTVTNAEMTQFMEDFAREAERMTAGAREAIDAIREVEAASVKTRRPDERHHQ